MILKINNSTFPPQKSVCVQTYQWFVAKIDA